jgi:two-component system, response regulator, stage 0 sporulation protein F
MKLGKHILVVEDDPDISNILVELFTDCGFKITTARRVADALEQVRKQHFDLITLDLRLPDKSGSEILHELSQSPNARPVVIISANLENFKPSPLVKAAIRKPFDLNNLLNIVEQYV